MIYPINLCNTPKRIAKAPPKENIEITTAPIIDVSDTVVIIASAGLLLWHSPYERYGVSVGQLVHIVADSKHVRQDVEQAKE